MIFAIGFILSIFGYYTVRIFGHKNLYKHNKADYIGIAALLIGIVLVTISLGKLAIEWLP